MKIEKLVVASHNQGKIDEIKRMMVPFKVDVVSARELELPDVEETGTTFRENAALKANQLSEISGLPCLADDSGLCVDALGGRPGVYSARYAGPERDFDRAMEHLIEELRNSGSNDWSAHFSCVLALKIPGRECRFFEGKVEGEIVSEKSGHNGFGFDPIFEPHGFDKTFANFTAEEKAKISHRGRAFEKFCRELEDLISN